MKLEVRKRLVVRPACLFTETSDILDGASDITPERVKYTNLDIGVSVQNGCPDIPSSLVDIIDQKTDPNTPLSGLVKRVNKQATDDIVVNHVVLGIDATFGNTGENSPGNKCIQAVSQ